ncbi:hypothetical protein P3T27_006641 [Kitasatospora sp. MAA19]|uniref:hypothetical protein n=1 Tax=Kitasatospora sp. MAA19 TaxID=3035090 RepID=UPI00247447FD|nr:hypothetical protein [Kitasatospora sp. MAA19]MDH6709892.1 hypothetical protein [Kitasatospora sp. MAA19]
MPPETDTDTGTGTAAGRRAGRGRISPQPDGFYAPPAAADAGGLVVEFFGEDGRRAVYSFEHLPCPGLHAALAAAWARRVGTAGGLRTRGAADGSWSGVVRLVRWLGELSRPPRTLGALTLAHLRRYDQHRRMTTQGPAVVQEMHQVRALLKEVEPQEVLRPQVREYLEQPARLYDRWHVEQERAQVPGYSDREFAAIMAAARGDVVAIRRRHRAARDLVERFRAAPQDLDEPTRSRAAALARTLETGEVPLVHTTLAGGGQVADMAAWREAAGELFLTTQDIVPLLVLGVGLSGRNTETLKELSCEHRLLEDRAVAVNLLKRRRGKSRSRETIHWETGTDSSRLRTPGGWFLLLHELTAAGRVFSGSRRVWSIWAAHHPAGPSEALAARRAAHGHIDPFENRLGRQLDLFRWAARHGLTADEPDDADDARGVRPLKLTLGRLKKTVEVRTARTVGGHLPSASRTNTPNVSFLHYLRSDPRIRDWAEQVLTEALEDAEGSARAFRGRILNGPAAEEAARDPQAAAAALGTTAGTLAAARAGDLDTLVAACLDFEHSPYSGNGLCDVSFLTCLRCPNALVAEHHLPALFALLHQLQADLDTRDVDDWIGRHGATWLIVTRLILPKFTAAQREQARALAPKSLPTDLLDGFKEPS